MGFGGFPLYPFYLESIKSLNMGRFDELFVSGASARDVSDESASSVEVKNKKKSSKKNSSVASPRIGGNRVAGRGLLKRLSKDAVPSKDAEDKVTYSGRFKSSGSGAVMCELSLSYLYRRAFSEMNLLNLMSFEELRPGSCYNFITTGDVDGLSYLKVVLDKYDLDDLVISTWRIFGEDVTQLFEWYDQGRIKKMDLYLGDMFPTSFKTEYDRILQLFAERPGCGRVHAFNNHSKIMCGRCASRDFYFGVQLSCNVNNNPRTDNGCIICDKGIYEFYRDFFDNISVKDFDI